MLIAAGDYKTARQDQQRDNSGVQQIEAVIFDAFEVAGFDLG